MPTGNNTFGGGVTETLLGTGVLVLMLLAILLIFLVPRKYVLVPLLSGLFLLPFGQTLVVGGVHVFVTRILLLAGIIRAIVSRPRNGGWLGAGFNKIDGIFILWTVFRGLAFVITYGEMGAVINQMGFFWDALGGYFLIRTFVSDDEEVQRLFKTLAGIAIVLSAAMLYEKFFDFNLYSILTGTHLAPEIRNGSIRAQGPFHHAILAGTFGATLLPLFFWLWKSGKSKLLGIGGMLASTAITFSAASSTPVSAYLAAILAIALWPMRRNMRMIRWGMVVGIICLNFVMHAPVWYFLEHIDLAGGSAGQHRAELIDNFVHHFGDWWLVGTKDNAKWGFEMWDISNQYVAEGESGGLASFVCFVAILTMCFKRIGVSRKLAEGTGREWYFWLLGTAFFSHCVAFLGISYFDQTRYAWYALAGSILVATAEAAATEPVPEHPLETTLVRPPLRYSNPAAPGHASSQPRSLFGPVR